VPIKHGVMDRIKRFLFGSIPTPEPHEPDMSSMCSKCKIMDLYLKDVEKMHKIGLKAPAVPIQQPNPQSIREERPRYMSRG